MQYADLLTLQDVSLLYKLGGPWSRKIHWAIDGVDLNVRTGETLGLIGRNGSGKSTLVQLMAGILSPTRGEIVRNCRTVSLLTIATAFLPWLSGRDNAILGGLLLGLRRKGIKRRLDAIQEFSGLGDAFDDPVRTYSTGMSGRLGFSVAIQSSPDVVLIDEVLGVGDKEFFEKSSEKVREFIKGDQTVVLVSHAEQAIADMCSRVALMEQGKLVDVGEPAAVMRHYNEIVHAAEKVRRLDKRVA